MSTQTQNLEAVDVDHSPTRVSSLAAVAAALIAAVTSAPFAVLAVPLGFGGLAILASGLFGEPSRARVTLGAAGLFLSVLVAGGFGTPAEVLLISMIGTLLAWDLGQHAIGLGEQVGSHSQTQRNEIVHASLSAMVATISAAIGYLVFATAGGGRPVSALILLLVAVVFLAWALRT
ncbi:DUF7519 family protein [Halomontanus rarus]|uniref:DUF7519 family protein n=1 Tax=Halomontanus rarus TaxID=3034020 RepID=UPI001A998A6E